MTTPHDRQAQAYRGAGPADHWDGHLSTTNAVLHPPITGLHGIASPDHYDQGRGWDARRWLPKTLVQARTALTARITDPEAPDGPEHAAAYDDLSGS